jgi:hypothetical protein
VTGPDRGCASQSRHLAWYITKRVNLDNFTLVARREYIGKHQFIVADWKGFTINLDSWLYGVTAPMEVPIFAGTYVVPGVVPDTQDQANTWTNENKLS